MTRHPDPELATLIAEAIDAGLLTYGTREHEVACLVATKGQNRLSRSERETFETKVLPILAKPLSAQILVRSLARRSNRLPPRIPSQRCLA